MILSRKKVLLVSKSDSCEIDFERSQASVHFQYHLFMQFQRLF